MNNSTYALFLIIQASASALANGLFPAIQSYSCLPYGNIAYHLAINLGSMANPIACYILFFITFTSLHAISLMAFPALIVAAYIFITATMSPAPPLVGTQSGEALVVSMRTVPKMSTIHLRLLFPSFLTFAGYFLGFVYWPCVVYQIGCGYKIPEERGERSVLVRCYDSGWFSYRCSNRFRPSKIYFGF